MKYPLVLFDLDGVIIDTEPAYSGFWTGIGREILPDVPDFAPSIKGNTLTMIIERYFRDKPTLIDEIVRRLDEFEATMQYPLIPGALEFVAYLRQLGCRTAVVTSSNRVKMEHLYRSIPDFASRFDRIFTAEDSTTSKPAPGCYLHAAEVMGYAVKDCAIFEDSFNGLQAARAAGATVFGVATALPVETLRTMCDVVVTRYEDILSEF